ncbi:MAG: rhomboid family intramembrane serine protease [Flavobacteriaceae bacterium]|nr:rhomboid family intramembrane serine protease [Flavobacteriaceae bacterium]MBT3919500.1 rhomboid family intramembrane serine protease [Flavobacteriaceae bacterium]MBT6704588.1 rhomboid family intramembrane serine protease [Flavobacteriaceae bacterium]MBT7242355.1 rhomboid family intramembrane serine protease [Flavobacteriaceae bacterium]
MNTSNLLDQFKQASIVLKIIVINTLIFLVLYLGAFFFKLSPASFVSWLVLPTSFVDIILQPWSIITYAFLHAGFWHLFWNMYLLYWFGTYVFNLFTAKRFLTIYLLGGICGGLLYVLSYNLFPVFSNINSNLMGASAAVLAIVIFIATYTPNTIVRVFMFKVKLWKIGFTMVLLDLLQLPSSDNAGGLIAHIGGALFGYVYAIQLKKGNDIGIWFENFIDLVINLFKPRHKKPFKKVHRTKQAVAKQTKKKTSNEHQAKIDDILDKIGKSGYDSLTKSEKDFLFKAGKND